MATFTGRVTYRTEAGIKRAYLRLSDGTQLTITLDQPPFDQNDEIEACRWIERQFGPDPGTQTLPGRLVSGHLLAIPMGVAFFAAPADSTVGTYSGIIWKTTSDGIRQAWLRRDGARRLLILCDTPPSGRLDGNDVIAGRLWVDRHYLDGAAATLKGQLAGNCLVLAADA